ncbi:PilN domain-containing protein [Geomonas sp.]|uniref:PilN domain-containing protein n=1 Tax=Geomonas sp. TaxID=2651584 RepID=UPI002B48E3EF|nr:PilN domain-containing protein [Geomonas sp.]HJV35816.1 PilN domain-containing protein [Geomonas sp.]
MIRINLLPVRASKKRETVRQQVSILVLSVIGVLVVGVSMYGLLSAKVTNAKQQIESSENDLKSLKSKIGAIDNIKKLQAEVKKKLDVLSQLRKAKTGPAARLAALSDAVPEKLWLTKYVESGNSVSISGVALNEELIAAFMKNLQNSGSFANIELQITEQTDVSGVKAKRFDLGMVIKS